MRIMAKLLADFLVKKRDYVNKHLDDFAWEGTTIKAVLEDDIISSCGCICSSMEMVMERKDDLLKGYSCVVVRDNIAREQKAYFRKGG